MSDYSEAAERLLFELKAAESKELIVRRYHVRYAESLAEENESRRKENYLLRNERDNLLDNVRRLEDELKDANQKLETLGTADNPEFDATDAAHPAWWRGHEHTAEVFCKLVNEILDGKPLGGIAGQPWEDTRRRLEALVNRPPLLQEQFDGFTREQAERTMGVLQRLAESKP